MSESDKSFGEYGYDIMRWDSGFYVRINLPENHPEFLQDNTFYTSRNNIEAKAISKIQELAYRHLCQDPRVLITLDNPIFDSLTQPIARYLLGSNSITWKQDLEIYFQCQPGSLQYLVLKKLITSRISGGSLPTRR